ncbi:hypothetical protein NQZ68_002366 [Dissostichus eleginoides]|nr:hypothetical protein NQZ68_002366 [Dissostichus eleginoides]
MTEVQAVLNYLEPDQGFCTKSTYQSSPSLSLKTDKEIKSGQNRNLKTTLNFTASTSWRQQYDNCQFYFKMLTIGTMVGARKGVEEEMGALDLLDGSHSGDPINITSNANTKSA